MSQVPLDRVGVQPSSIMDVMVRLRHGHMLHATMRLLVSNKE